MQSTAACRSLARALVDRRASVIRLITSSPNAI
jgi:hypothetical protein